MTKQPKKVYGTGRVQVAVWENERKRKDGTSFLQNSFVPKKTYKDKNGNWKTTSGFDFIEIRELHALLLQIIRDYEGN
jgi:hypothetical protein